MAQTVVVTGSLSYLGSRLTSYLGERGYRCVGYDLGLFKECTLYPPGRETTTLKDVRDLTERDLDGASAVVHLAGISNDPFGSLNPESVYEPSRVYTRRLGELCKRLGLRLIFASSCSVYGVGGDQVVTEEAPTFPQTPYSLNKLQCEQDLLSLSSNTFRPLLFRFATVYGLSPRMRFDIVVNMLVGMALTSRRIILNSNGRAWRPLVHIEDVCQAIEHGLRGPADESAQVLNVGDTQGNYLILDIADMVRRSVPGCEIEFLQAPQSSSLPEAVRELVHDRKIQDGVDSRTYRVSCERITSVLPEFRCRWTLQRGIEDMVERFRALGLTKEQFTDKRYYRVPTLEALLRAKRLTADLRWSNSGEARGMKAPRRIALSIGRDGRIEE